MECFVIECVKCGAKGVFAIKQYNPPIYKWFSLHELSEALKYSNTDKEGYFIGLCPHCIKDTRDVACNQEAINTIKKQSL